MTGRPPSDLTGRRILVTGAASGIGRAVAALCAEHGARVALLDRDPAVREVAASLPGAIGLPGDVTDEASVDQALVRAAADLEGLDGVVNCAGVDLVAPLAVMSLADWSRVLAVNLTGAFLVCRAAAPVLKAEAEATIVNVASGAGLQPLPHRTAYCAAKAGLIMFSKALSLELATNVRVNAVCPGAVDTPLFRSSYEHAPDPPAERARIADRYVLKRIATAGEIAQAVLFLTSRASSFVTGAALAVDGGRTFH